MSTAKGSQRALHDLTYMHHRGEALLLMKRQCGAAVASTAHQPVFNALLLKSKADGAQACLQGRNPENEETALNSKTDNVQACLQGRAAEPSYCPKPNSPSACIQPTVAEQQRLTVPKPICRGGLLLLLAQAIPQPPSVCTQTTVGLTMLKPACRVELQKMRRQWRCSTC